MKREPCVNCGQHHHTYEAVFNCVKQSQAASHTWANLYRRAIANSAPKETR